MHVCYKEGGFTNQNENLCFYEKKTHSLWRDGPNSWRIENLIPKGENLQGKEQCKNQVSKIVSHRVNGHTGCGKATENKHQPCLTSSILCGFTAAGPSTWKKGIPHSFKMGRCCIIKNVQSLSQFPERKLPLSSVNNKNVFVIQHDSECLC